MGRARYKQVAVVSGSSETTHYVGGLYEKIIKGSLTTQRYYIQAGQEAIAVQIKRTSGDRDDLRYLFRDHLGSIDTITDRAGVVKERLSYDAWGQRRFRVVDDVELGSIMATKNFSIRPAGFQQKQFFPGIEDARFFATEGLARLGVTVDVSIVQTSVSVETYRLGYEFLDAGRLAVSFGPEELPALNADAQRNGIFVRESYP